MNENKIIYMDNAATTRMSESVLSEMLPYFREIYGNPSSVYRIGRDAHREIESARKRFSDIIGAGPMEIYFTSSGTEADNWALKGTMRKLGEKGKTHLITSAIEHHAVLHSAKALEKEGFEVTYLPVDEKGRVDPAEVKAAVRPETGLVSIMYANNEIGTIQPVAEIGQICSDAGVLFHTDAVQAAGILRIDVNELHIDMLSVSAHKFNGPKGVGALYCRRGKVPQTFMDGGAQERDHRAGTENVAGIMGMVKAFEEAAASRDEEYEHLLSIRDRMQAGLESISGSRVNGDQSNRLPGNLNMSFEGIDGQSLLFSLDLKGVQASSGSACSSGSIDPSHVLMAIGIPYEMAHGSLRLSAGRYNTLEEADRVVEIVAETVKELRK